MKVYISGAITGLDYTEVVAKFALAEERIRKLGYTPVNPLNNGLAKDSSWEQHMAVDIAMLMECDMIYILNDAIDSRGARIEIHLAVERDMMRWHEQKGQYRLKQYIQGLVDFKALKLWK